MIRQWGLMVVCWLLILAAAGYQLMQMLGVNAPEAPEPPKHKVSPKFSTAWQDESQFVVTSICSDLTEMAFFANQSRGLGADFRVKVEEKLFSADHPVYQVTAHLPDGRELSRTLTFTSSIWDPEMYQEWCRALQPRAQVSQPIQSDAILAKLTDPRPTVLAQLDRELSLHGFKSMGDFNWHDQAALLLVSLALREPSGTFFQIRQELSRTCAHLAMSDCLRGASPASPCHQLAQAALACLYRREDVAAQLLKPLSDSGPVGTWKRALRIRSTCDYRIKVGGSLLEERERFLAEFTVGSCAGGWKHRSRKPEWRGLADWNRFAGSVLAWHNDTPGVVIGHELLEAGLPSELAEIQQVWQAEGWDKSGLPSDLNTPPQSCVGGPSDKPVVQVIGKGGWAWFLQRQLCHVAVSDWLFLEESLGDPDGAKEYAHQFERKFSKLRLYPFVLRRIAWDEASYHQAQDDAGTVVRSAPESVPAYAWNWLCYTHDDYPLYRPTTIQVVNEWHHQNPLPGTAYDLQPRMNHPSFFSRKDFQEKLTQLQAASPHDPVLYSYLLKKIRLDGEAKRKILQPSRDYNADAAFRMATECGLPSAQSQEWLARAVTLNPRYLVRALNDSIGEDRAYEAYFEKWLKTSPDAVELANHAHQMIRIYESSGRQSKASALADQAAETYSSLGLCAKADLLERRGQLDEALEYYRRVEQRYNESGPLLGGLSRAAAKDPKYQPRFQEMLPGGLQAYQKSSVKPERGVLVTSEVADLRKGDIIVAIRGFAIASQDQYVQIRDTQKFSEFKIVIYRRDKYLEMGPYRPRYRFGNLKDYP